MLKMTSKLSNLLTVVVVRPIIFSFHLQQIHKIGGVIVRRFGILREIIELRRERFHYHSTCDLAEWLRRRADK